MRVELWVDMEGTSQITDHRECWPAFPEYWHTGRNKLMSDVVASAEGLLEGGASEVVVINAHGLGWPNILAEKLPQGVKTDEENDNNDFDAIFQVGFHSRAGTANGFLSHTMVPNIMSVELDGNPITESHIWTFVNELPLIGVVGDGALSPQLDGVLKRTPFLGVKNSSSRMDTKSVFPNVIESKAAIKKFAKDSMEAGLPKSSQLPKQFNVSIKLNPEISKQALEVEAKNWAQDVQPVLETAMGTAMQSFFELSGDLDLASEEEMNRQNPESLENLRKYFIEWIQRKNF